jgi:hypothetical protein
MQTSVLQTYHTHPEGVTARLGLERQCGIERGRTLAAPHCTELPCALKSTAIDAIDGVDGVEDTDGTDDSDPIDASDASDDSDVADCERRSVPGSLESLPEDELHGALIDIAAVSKLVWSIAPGDVHSRSDAARNAPAPAPAPAPASAAGDDAGTAVTAPVDVHAAPTCDASGEACRDDGFECSGEAAGDACRDDDDCEGDASGDTRSGDAAGDDWTGEESDDEFTDESDDDECTGDGTTTLLSKSPPMPRRGTGGGDT